MRKPNSGCSSDCHFFPLHLFMEDVADLIQHLAFSLIKHSVSCLHWRVCHSSCICREIKTWWDNHSTESLKYFSCLLAQMIYPTWSVPFTLSWNSPLWLMVSHYYLHYTHSFSLSGFDIFHCLRLLGCKVEMFDLKVEAVNTHRDRPLVSLQPLYCVVL